MSWYSSQNQQQQTPERGGAGAHKAITGAASNGGPNLIRITVPTHGFSTGNKVDVTGVRGTVEANGVGWVVTNIDANNFDLQASVFVNAYTAGGLVRLQ